LTEQYGRGFSKKSLWHRMRFAELFPDEEIVSALRRQLRWTHFKELIYLDDSLKRGLYAALCRVERWSTRTLRQKIGHLLYERTAVTKQPEVLIAKDIAALRDEDRLTPDMVFRDLCFLEFQTNHHPVLQPGAPRASAPDAADQDGGSAVLQVGGALGQADLSNATPSATGTLPPWG
jgi:hypothetical protein